MSLSRPKRPGLWGLLHLAVTLRSTDADTKAGCDTEVVRVGERYCRRWRGTAELYKRLSASHWALSHWREAIRYGRMARVLNPGMVDAAVYMLAAYRSHDPRQGIAFGEAWLSRFGVNPKVCRHLSFLYDDLDRHAEALTVVRLGHERFPGDRRLAACVGHYLAKVEGADAALGFAEKHRALFRKDTYCRTTLASGLSSAGAYREAAAILEELHGDAPGDAAIFESLLEAWYHLDNYKEMLEAIGKWERARPLTASMANDAGRACLELGRGDEGLAWMKRAMELQPGNVKYADNHAISLGRLDRHAECIEACAQRLASGLPVDRRRLLRAKAVAHTYLLQHAGALECYQAAFREAPGQPDSVVDLMSGLGWLRRYEEVISLAREHRGAPRVVALPRYWSELAWAFHELGRFAEEEEAVREWATREPDGLGMLRAMKRALNSLGRSDRALSFVRSWVEAHPAVAWGWYHLAEQHEADGDAAAEGRALDEACRLGPDDSELLSARLAWLRRLKRSQEALDAGVAWIGSHPGAASPGLLNRIGLAADDLELWPAAVEYYGRAHAAEPSEGTFVGNLMRAHICGGRAAEAAEIGRGWLAKYPWSNYAGGKMAWACREAGLPEEEETVLRRALEADPKDDEAAAALLANLVTRQEDAQAEAWLRGRDAAGLATSRLHNDWANRLRELERFDDAESTYRRALELGPSNDVAAGNLAALLIDRNRPGEAAAFCREWLGRHPSHLYVRRRLAEACYDQADFAAAEVEYRQLVEAEPGTGSHVARHVACLRLVDRYEEAIALTKEWLKEGDATAFLLVEAGIASHGLQRLDDALGYYEQALQLDPEYTAAALRKMIVLGELERLDQALDFGAEWGTLHPKVADADFHNRLAILQDRAGRTADAEAGFLKAAELDSNNPTFAGNAVEIIARRGRTDDAIQLGQRMLANCPPNAYLLRRLAEAHCLGAEHAEALDLLASADELDPDDENVAHGFLRTAIEGDETGRGIGFGRAWLERPGHEANAGVWAQLARVYFRANRDDEAFAALDKAVALEPDEVRHVRQRFSFLTSLGESTRIVREFPELRPEWQEDAQLLRFASRAWHELGLQQEALAAAERNVRMNPADDESCAWFAELQDKCGRADDARECIRHWIGLHGEQPAVLRVRAGMQLEADEPEAALADAEQVLAHDETDEAAFAIAVRSLRKLDRKTEARARLNHWVEHHGSSSLISRLLDEQSGDDGY